MPATTHALTLHFNLRFTDGPSDRELTDFENEVVAEAIEQMETIGRGVISKNGCPDIELVAEYN